MTRSWLSLLPNRSRFLMVAALLGATLSFATDAPSAASCPFDCSQPRLAESLDRVASKLLAGQDLTIVAVGSSSTAGVGATSPKTTYPAALQALLTRKFPHSKVTVVNKGVSGETYHQMVARFERDVLPLHPDLVIWQLGTNAVINQHGLRDDEEHLIESGVERLRMEHVDVILMNLQYAPAVTRDPDCTSMLQVLDEVGQREHVSVFQRFELMRTWASSAGAAQSKLLQTDGLHLTDVGYRCIAASLADAIGNTIAIQH